MLMRGNLTRRVADGIARGLPAGGELPPGSGGLRLAGLGGSLIAPGPAVMPAVPDPARVAGAVARYMALREFRARLTGA
jgi:hypothetical protein